MPVLQSIRKEVMNLTAFAVTCGFLCFAGFVVARLYDTDDERHTLTYVERKMLYRQHKYHTKMLKYHARKVVEIQNKLKRK